MTTLNRRTVTAEELLYVLDGWTGKDDWGMDTYPYPDTVRDLLTDLHNGDNPRALRLLAKTTDSHKFHARLVALCPSHWARELAQRAQRAARAT